MAEFETRLTALAHGGGCGCKLSPAVLRELLAGMPAVQAFPDLLVGIETGDDAAVYRLNDEQAVVATTDFFMPIVDDPFDFGRIAAANALSDVYAMGGRPILALAILGMPSGQDCARRRCGKILAGGAAVCAEAGIPVAGGHSIDSPEPIYGLVAIGLVKPDRVLRNSGAKPGDVLILSKALGVGVISAALKSGKLDPEVARTLYATLVDSTTRLNAVGHALAAVAAGACDDRRDWLRFVGAWPGDVSGFEAAGTHPRSMRCPCWIGVADLARFPIVPAPPIAIGRATAKRCRSRSDLGRVAARRAVRSAN